MKPKPELLPLPRPMEATLTLLRDWLLARCASLSTADRRALVGAAVVAAALLVAYVQLLHASLARGNELREVQRAAALVKVSKATEAPKATASQAPAPQVTQASALRVVKAAAVADAR